jgi:hypothetical protein
MTTIPVVIAFSNSTVPLFVLLLVFRRNLFLFLMTASLTVMDFHVVVVVREPTLVVGFAALSHPRNRRVAGRQKIS